jgi:hypothetical protein
VGKITFAFGFQTQLGYVEPMTKVSTRKKAAVAPTPNERAAAQIRAYMAARRLTAVELAAAIEMPRSTASRRLVGQGSFDLDQMVLIAGWLKVPLADIIDPPHSLVFIAK